MDLEPHVFQLIVYSCFITDCVKHQPLFVRQDEGFKIKILVKNDNTIDISSRPGYTHFHCRTIFQSSYLLDKIMLLQSVFQAFKICRICRNESSTYVFGFVRSVLRGKCSAASAIKHVSSSSSLSSACYIDMCRVASILFFSQHCLKVFCCHSSFFAVTDVVCSKTYDTSQFPMKVFVVRLDDEVSLFMKQRYKMFQIIIVH